MQFNEWAWADLFSFAEFLHIVGEVLHAILSQLQVDSFLEFRQKKIKTEKEIIINIKKVFFQEGHLL